MMKKYRYNFLEFPIYPSGAMMETLNRWGEGGWKVIAVVMNKGQNIFFFLMKEVDE